MATILQSTQIEMQATLKLDHKEIEALYLLSTFSHEKIADALGASITSSFSKGGAGRESLISFLGALPQLGTVITVYRNIQKLVDGTHEAVPVKEDGGQK